LDFTLLNSLPFLFSAGKIASQEIGSLLVETPEGTKKDLPSVAYALAFLAGVIFLAAAYGMAISGLAWDEAGKMGLTLILGFAGTLVTVFRSSLSYGFFWQNAAVTVKSCRPLLSASFRKCHSPFHDIGCQLPVDFSGTVLF